MNCIDWFGWKEGQSYIQEGGAYIWTRSPTILFFRVSRQTVCQLVYSFASFQGCCGEGETDGYGRWRIWRMATPDLQVNCCKFGYNLLQHHHECLAGFSVPTKCWSQNKAQDQNNLLVVRVEQRLMRIQDQLPSDSQWLAKIRSGRTFWYCKRSKNSVLMLPAIQLIWHRWDDMWWRMIHRLELVNNLSEKLNTGAVAWARIGEACVLASIVHAIAKKGLSSNSSAMKIMQELDHDKTAEEWLFDHQRNPQNIANCIWVCGKLEIMLPNLVQMLDKHVQRFIDRTRQPQNIAKCVLAYVRAKLGIKLSNLFWLLEERTEWLVDNGNPQEVVNYVWAYGKLGIKSSSDLFHLIDKHVQWLFDHRQPQNIANY